jgi:hypothetical protein
MQCMLIMFAHVCPSHNSSPTSHTVIIQRSRVATTPRQSQKITRCYYSFSLRFVPIRQMSTNGRLGGLSQEAGFLFNLSWVVFVWAMKGGRAGWMDGPVGFNHSTTSRSLSGPRVSVVSCLGWPGWGRLPGIGRHEQNQSRVAQGHSYTSATLTDPNTFPTRHQIKHLTVVYLYYFTWWGTLFLW